MMHRIDRVMTWAFPVVVILLGVFYYSVNPGSDTFAIRCVWRDLTSTQCPACGLQRALHALLHGDLRSAIGYNYFFILSVPYALLVVLASWYNYGHVFDRLRRFVFCGRTLKAYACLYFGWWVVRNLLKV